MNQLELHKKIDNFFKAGTSSASANSAQELMKNEDAKRYFFSQANESWLTWLWDNGFLDTIKIKSEDSTRYSYRLPELEYLTKVSEKDPAGVTQIIKSVQLSDANFNPEVIDRFLWIISTLPAKEIKRLTTKIRDEKWVYLMRNFPKSGYEFNQITKKLVENKENSSILELAESILIVKSKEALAEKNSRYGTDDPFYVSDLDASGIFEALTNIAEPYTEKALQITTSTMGVIVKLAGPDETKVFDYEDLFALYDVDFFTLKIESKPGMSYKEDIKNLAATVKELIERTIGKKCDDSKEAQRLLVSYIKSLPSSRSMWRLTLFALSQCPKAFKNELKNAFFKVFDVGERYFEIEGGAEYHQALIGSFGIFDPIIQRDYVQNVFDYFGANLDDIDKKKWRKRDGAKILSFVKKHLTTKEKSQAQKKFGVSLDKVSYTPEPTIGKIRGGTVNHRSPVKLEDFTINQIILNLKSEWTPEKFSQQFKDDDFLSPRGVEGLGDALKVDVKNRTDAYLENINAFFDRSAIHPHYLYSLLRGIEEMLRNKQTLSTKQTGQIFGLFKSIRDEGQRTAFIRKDDDSWLVDWIETHKVITDILLFAIQNNENKIQIHKKYREDIKYLISYLFTIKDSPSKDQEKPEYGEPYHIAINSVRGRAYEAFVVFTENDGQTLKEDLKELYKESLADDSLAVHFVIGRYLATFYFRDKEFISGLFSEIFPKDKPEQKDIYMATWEGYLSNTLYDKLFAILEGYYEYAITLDPKMYTERKYSKGLDESLAIHIALAFAHLGLKMTDSLFTHFWNKPNIVRHKEFISFIGRSCLTRDQADDEWLKENQVSKDGLISFWNWALDNDSVEPESLSGFGYWVNPNKEVLDDKIVVEKVAGTLKKSDGDIDWDYGLLKRLTIFAEKNGEKTLEIIANYLLNKNNNLNQHRTTPILYGGEIKDALKIIYKNGNSTVKQQVIGLINTLVEKGSSMFWELKEVITNNIKE